jgi:hypothetical protein
MPKTGVHIATAAACSKFTGLRFTQHSSLKDCDERHDGDTGSAAITVAGAPLLGSGLWRIESP